MSLHKLSGVYQEETTHKLLIYMLCVCVCIYIYIYIYMLIHVVLTSQSKSFHRKDGGGEVTWVTTGVQGRGLSVKIDPSPFSTPLWPLGNSQCWLFLYSICPPPPPLSPPRKDESHFIQVSAFPRSPNSKVRVPQLDPPLSGLPPSEGQSVALVLGKSAKEGRALCWRCRF